MTNRAVWIFVVTLAVVALLCFLQQLLNLKRVRRARQAALPAIALLYGVIVITLAVRHLAEPVGLLAGLPGGVRTGVAEPVVAMNGLLVVGFLVLKAVLLPIVNLIWKNRRVVAFTSKSVYGYNPDYGEWFIHRRWANVRVLGLAFTLCLGVICAAFMGIMLVYGSDSELWLFCFPAAALVVVGEIYSFINGQTQLEFLSEFLGSDASARRVSSFYRIREVYEKMFAPQLLAAHTGCDLTQKKSSVELMGKLASGDRAERMTAEYFAYRDGERKPDLDNVMATSKLMGGESVVFLNPFYRDVGFYIVLPITKALLAGKKCLVIAGRNSTFDDLRQWLRSELVAFNKVQSLWRIEELNEHTPDCEIGIISSRHMFDMNILKANSAFFSSTDFVFIVEPSNIINIGQIGFNLMVDEIHKNIAKPVFCICDRPVDGLVDTLSHLLRTELTEVIAAPVPRCIYSGMAWNADGDYSRHQLFDKQTRYLGNGLELAAVAVKNQIPEVIWYSETKSPVSDIHWIAGQYHPIINRFMNLPSQQANLYDKIKFESNIWKPPIRNEAFILVEDEFCNMFGALRAYLSRGKDQTFVNVLSENYLLRDYLRCNRQLFLADPGSVPSFAPDYAKTVRNTLMKLILQMTVRPVREAEVLEELYLAGYKTTDAFGALAQLVAQYSSADASIFTIKSMVSEESAMLTDTVNTFTILPEAFEAHFADSLKSAYYIVEDEKSEHSYIDAKLFGHVAQTILPGQFVTYDGKYYYAKYVSPESGVVLRRASDLYDGRKYYRQIRRYVLDKAGASVVEIRRVMDVEIASLCCTFSTHTTGYLELNDNCDLRTARVVDFADDPHAGEYSRHYRNKSVLRLHFPEADDKIRFTLCMLMMEVFRSVFPNAWPYLAVVATRPDDISGMLNHIVHDLEGDIDDAYIYVIEDSDVDLGLIDAVEKNLLQIMEIMADFLDWHFEKMSETPEKDPIPGPVAMPPDVKRRGLFQRMAGYIRRIVGGREQEVTLPRPERVAPARPIQAEEVPAPAPEEAEYRLSGAEILEDDRPAMPIAEDESDLSEAGSDAAEAEGASVSAPSPHRATMRREDMIAHGEEDDADLIHISEDGTDIFEEAGSPIDNQFLEELFVEAGITPATPTRYQKECYLKYGFETIDARIRVEEVRDYLRSRGFSDNALARSRRQALAPMRMLDLEATNHCDFCGLPLSGISYEKMADGRIRCRDCATSAIETVEEARELFFKVSELLSSFFGIQFNVAIGIKMTDARTIARAWGRVFRPSTEVTSRVLGYASRQKGSYFVCVENGSPRLVFLDTLVHELTHVWQYINWNDKEIAQLYGTGRNRDLVYEGMASWAAIQYMYFIGETSYAEAQEALITSGDDVYGEGLRMYMERYPFIKDFTMPKFSPFTSLPPL